VLRGQVSRNSESAKKVQKYYEDGNYRMPTAKRHVLILLPDFKNQFFIDLAHHLGKALRRSDLLPHVAYSDERLEEEMRLYQFYSQNDLSGVIYAPATTDSSVTTRIANDDIPLVLLDRIVKEDEDHDTRYVSVAVDNSEGVQDAIKWLHNEHKHDRIGFVKGPALLSSADQRFEGYVKALTECDLESDEDWIFYGDFSRASGHAAGKAFAQRTRDSRPTAVMCANDAMAIGFLLALHEQGISVPKEVSLLGFDGTEEVQWTFPTITTVSQKVQEIVSNACGLLVDLIAGIEPSNRQVRVHPRLEAGASVGPPQPVDAEDVLAREEGERK
jgi:DNA-binding LacI/PurR family transcriptional regulator